MADKLFLIDGTAIIYRAYFAFIRNPLVNSKGQNTGALYGTINSFLRLIERYDVRNLAISFDRKEETFRHQITATYKANRPPAPDELVAQIEPIKKFFELINTPEVSCPGYEADDVLATIAERFKSDYEVIIVTGDKDFTQLVDERVNLYDPFKEKVTDRKEVETRFGLKPEQFIDYLALCGDATDNIPGVAGIGPKGAVKLLQEFGDLDSVYKNIDKIRVAGIREKLQNSRENAYLSRRLAEIVRQVPIAIKDKDFFVFHREDLKNSLTFLKEFELNSIVRKIDSGDEVSSENIEPAGEDSLTFNTIIIDNSDKFRELEKYLADKKIIAIDTETTSQDPLQARLVGISLCAAPARAYYIPLTHQMSDNADKNEVIGSLREIVASKILVGHNIKYDYMIFENEGWQLAGDLFDTMIADYLLHPTDRHSLSACARREFGYEMVPIKELIGSGQKQITFDLVPLAQAAPYSAADANMTFRLYDVYRKRMEEQDLTDLYYRIELPLFRAIARMERNGVYLDTDILAEISLRNQKEIAEIARKIYEIAGYQFNLNSTQQLAKVLFEELGIPPVKKIKTGYSTDVKVLEILAREHEIARLLMDYRQLTKLESTYVQALPELINPASGRVHSSFNQTVASTGRLSSSNPNLQNIPIRTEIGKEIRNAFTCQDKDNLILAADYSQIELRILAILSRDPSLIEAFRNGRDIHTETASIIYEKDRKDVTSDERRFAKIINFGLLYGMGAFRISNELNIPRAEAQEFVDNYFNKFPTVRDYLKGVILRAREEGFVATIFGRRLYLPEINSKNRRLAQEAERIATNMPIQGSAADIIKIAMIRIHQKVKDREDIKMIIQVHDELVFEVRNKVLEEAQKMIVTEMEAALPEEYARIVPLTVDVGIGRNWFEAH
ncbi:MAG: DNA polymerase I [Candidatus Cloacimonetes bacterium]|nr:DNA polymerase I [Candidatus Cloacimonadota bacterium]